MIKMSECKRSIARATVACLVASAMTAAVLAAPALAGGKRIYRAGTEPKVEVREGWDNIERPHEYGMSHGEAVWYARNHFGLEPEDVEDLDVDRVMYQGVPCYEVEFETPGSTVEHHVIVEATNGDVLVTWKE